MKLPLAALCGALMLGAEGCSPATDFVRVDDGRFVRGDETYPRFIGANLWYGALLATEGPSGDRERLCRELDRLHGMGVGNLRILVGAEGGYGVRSKVEPILQPEPGRYDERCLEGLDFLMAELGRRDMQAVLYLTNAWEWSGGYAQYLEWTGRGVYPIPAEVPWSTFRDYAARFHENDEDPCRTLFEEHIRRIVTRTNRYTGRPYAEDPAIFSWQLCNEPRPFSAGNKERFYRWVARTARLIKSLDPNHMVSTGSEGEVGCERDLELWRRIHALPEIDYLNIHIWPCNWGWADRSRLTEEIDTAIRRTTEYIDTHLAVARELRKPLVIEEFGYPRDGLRFDVGSPVTARDAYYRHLFGRVVQSAAEDDLLAGCNFWAWGGTCRPRHLHWQPGDPYCGDPAQEEQGLYALFDNDSTTLRILDEAVAALRKHE